MVSSHLAELRSDAEQVSGQVVLPPVSRDPKDDKFIACAVEGNANYIVSGDDDLLDLEEYQGIGLITAREFITMLQLREEQDSEPQEEDVPTDQICH